MKTKTIITSAMVLSLGVILPFFTGQIPQIGSQLCHMHFPVFMAGMLLGGKYGLMIGMILPLLRSFIFGMPLFINALCMAFELATYGFVAGMMKERFQKNDYSSLIVAMFMGRLIWGIVSFIIYTAMGNPFTFSMFISGAFLMAIPGIILQLMIVPPIVKLLKRYV